MNRVRNEEVHRKAGIERELTSRTDEIALRWFGHVERMDEYRMTRRVLMADVTREQVRGKPSLDWMDGEVALGSRGKTVEAARHCAKDRKELRALMPRPFLLGPVFFRTTLPNSSGFSPGGGWDAFT